MIFEIVKFGKFLEFFFMENHNLISKIGKFWFCASIRYSALFVISPIPTFDLWNSKPYLQKFQIWEIRQFPKLLWLTNLKNYQIFAIFLFEKFTNFQNFTIWKINIIQFEELLNILSIRIISKKWQNKFDNKTIE